jgi:hypothetical protein
LPYDSAHCFIGFASDSHQRTSRLFLTEPQDMVHEILQAPQWLLRATRSSFRTFATPSTSLAVGRSQSTQRAFSTSSAVTIAGVSNSQTSGTLRQRSHNGRSWAEESRQRSWRRDQHQLLFAGSSIAGHGGRAANRRTFSSSAGASMPLLSKF